VIPLYTAHRIIWIDKNIWYIMLTHFLASSMIESRVTPGKIRPFNGGVAISGSEEEVKASDHHTETHVQYPTNVQSYQLNRINSYQSFE